MWLLVMCFIHHVRNIFASIYFNKQDTKGGQTYTYDFAINFYMNPFIYMRYSNKLLTLSFHCLVL